MELVTGFCASRRVQAPDPLDCETGDIELAPVFFSKRNISFEDYKRRYGRQSGKVEPGVLPPILKLDSRHFLRHGIFEVCFEFE
jgi:hypothetical protein